VSSKVTKFIRMKEVEITPKKRIQILLDEYTILCLKSESQEKGLGVSTLIRSIILDKFNNKLNGKD
jgi:hypothetical protein